jgi:putative hemolysin
MRATRMIVKAVLILSLFGTAWEARAQSTATATATAVAGSQRGAYCTSTGGVVQTREAAFGTNNPPQEWLLLAGLEDFCQYTASDGSQINLSLLTLTTPKPTLAALAYYAQVPWNGIGNGNPASFYCTQLGGAEIGATDASGGGWVVHQRVDDVLEACIFPDNSTIDSWGLLYHANSIIRGIDLSTVLIYPNPYLAKGSLMPVHR